VVRTSLWASEERVLLALRDSLEFVATWYAVLKTGAVVDEVRGRTSATSTAPSAATTTTSLAMLDLALSLWPILAAQPSPLGIDVEQYLAGQEIHDMREDAQVRMVGRRGGTSGVLFAKDVPTGAWKKHRYEVSSKNEALAGNPNWFTVEEFVIWVTGA